MKTLITIILATLLAACGNGQIETTVKSDVDQTVVAVPQPAQIATPPVSIPEPEPTPPPQTGCNLTTYIPCAEPVTDVIPVNETCNFETFIPCRAYPPVCTGNKTLVQGICTAP
jgi:hypothetical protein